MSIDASNFLLLVYEKEMEFFFGFFRVWFLLLLSKQEILSIEIWFTTYFSHFFKFFSKGCPGGIWGLSRHQHFLSTHSFRVPGGIWHNGGRSCGLSGRDSSPRYYRQTQLLKLW